GTATRLCPGFQPFARRCGEERRARDVVARRRLIDIGEQSGIERDVRPRRLAALEQQRQRRDHAAFPEPIFTGPEQFDITARLRYRPSGRALISRPFGQRLDRAVHDLLLGIAGGDAAGSVAEIGLILTVLGDLDDGNISRHDDLLFVGAATSSSPPPWRWTGPRRASMCDGGAP